MDKYDVVIIGSGIGGLCCGSILALSGKKVLICEAHTQPGGVAHSFKRKGYTFESGPSLWSGIGKWPTSCLLYTSPSPRDVSLSRMPSSA